MNIIAYDFEFMRHIDLEKDFSENLEKIVYYLSHRGRTGIRFRYYDEMKAFEAKLRLTLENISVFNKGSVLIIRREELKKDE